MRIIIRGNKGGVKICDGCLCSGVFGGDILHGLEICEETLKSQVFDGGVVEITWTTRCVRKCEGIIVPPQIDRQ